MSEELPKIKGYCKDCKYYEKEGFGYCSMMKNEIDVSLDEEDYCSLFEKKKKKR
jgi:hypothetical protein